MHITQQRWISFFDQVCRYRITHGKHFKCNNGTVRRSVGMHTHGSKRHTLLMLPSEKTFHRLYRKHKYNSTCLSIEINFKLRKNE